MKQVIVAALVAVALAGCRRSHEGEADPLLGSTNPERGATSDWAKPAEPTGPAQPAPPSEVTGTPRLQNTPGQVRAVQGNQMVLVEDTGNVISLQVSPDAAITDPEHGTRLHVDQLAPGTRVLAAWRNENGQPTAFRVDVQPPTTSPGPNRKSR